MSFDSPVFFVLFVMTFVVSRQFPRFNGGILLAASLLFYSVAGIFDVAIAALVVLGNYALSFAVARNRRRWLWPTILTNLAVLAFFKYRGFFFPGLATEVRDFFQGEILIPLGISFYVFQAIAYQVDLARGHAALIRSPANFALFKLFFSQMIAGPIVRANKLAPQVARSFAGGMRGRKLWVLGLSLCVLGLIKKVVLADSLSPHVDNLFLLGPADVYSAWVGAAAFAFQIYFDFSGYSDIAVGTAYLLGFRLPINFRQPYLASDPSDFWQRWHITLSTWIRDYLYIPLGGNKGNVLRQFIVLFATMGLAGLWHGANWTFVCWGLLWGAYVGLWRLGKPLLDRLGPFRWFLHIVAVLVLWVFFRARSLSEAITFIGGMFGNPVGTFAAAASASQAVLITCGLLLLLLSQRGEAWLFRRDTIRHMRRIDHPVIWGVLIAIAFWLVAFPKSLINPFIYFRF